MTRIALLSLAAVLLAGGAAAKPPSWDTQLPAATSPWGAASDQCFLTDIGGRKGWRLPAMEELQSLIEPATGLPPAGHPFSFAEELLFWSASTQPEVPGSAYVLDPGVVAALTVDKAESRGVWCVRGGAGSTFD